MLMRMFDCDCDCDWYFHDSRIKNEKTQEQQNIYCQYGSAGTVFFIEERKVSFFHGKRFKKRAFRACAQHGQAHQRVAYYLDRDQIATFLQFSCNFLATFLQLFCNFFAAFLQLSCSFLAAFLQLSC